MQVESLKYRSHAELDSASQFSNILSADPEIIGMNRVQGDSKTSC